MLSSCLFSANIRKHVGVFAKSFMLLQLWQSEEMASEFLKMLSIKRYLNFAARAQLYTSFFTLYTDARKHVVAKQKKTVHYKTLYCLILP